MSINFTQYLRPDGRKQTVSIDRPHHIVEMAQFILLKGFKFEIEELMDGMVSMTVEKNFGDDGPIAHEICKNGLDVPLRVDQLIETAYQELKLQK